MLVPSKFTTFKESILSKMLSILNTTLVDENILDAHNRTKNEFNDVREFVYALDVLYLLNVININFETGSIKYVK